MGNETLGNCSPQERTFAISLGLWSLMVGVPSSFYQANFDPGGTPICALLLRPFVEGSPKLESIMDAHSRASPREKTGPQGSGRLLRMRIFLSCSIAANCALHHVVFL